jgi:hypothetical protein
VGEGTFSLTHFDPVHSIAKRVDVLEPDTPPTAQAVDPEAETPLR